MENSIKDIINNSLDQVRSVVGADTIIGQPIRTESGTIIIPVSKISIGVATGGLDIPAKAEGGKQGFGGGGGTGVTVSPIGFLTVYADGSVEMLPLSPTQSSPIEHVADMLDHAPELIARIKSVFDTEEKKEEDPAQEQINELRAAAAAAAQAKLEDELRREQEAAEAEASLSKREKKALKKQQKKEEKLAKKEANKND